MNARARIIEEAHTWLGTPWRHAQCAKGAGVDCAMLLCAVYHSVGIVPWIDPRPYPPDWHLHRDRERIIEIMERYARRLQPDEVPQPGDIALYRYGRTASHSAIIESDEMAIHADITARMVTRIERASLLPRLDSYWSIL